MASVAAVEADRQRPLLPDTLGDPDRERTGLIGPKDSPVPDSANEVVGAGATRKIRPLNDDGDDGDDGAEVGMNGGQGHNEDDGDEDLFGEGVNDPQPAQRRQLDDKELDSGDDLDRNDRAALDEDTAVDDDGAVNEEELAQESYLETPIARHAIPDPSDGELYLLKIPRFLSIEPKSWDHTTFQPPTTEHHAKPPSQNFSAFTTAITTLRWRRSPSNPAHIQSNARVLRWSDGSLTLQLASNPESQYELPGNPLAFPQQNPLKPTPTSVKAKHGRAAHNTKYDQQQDSFTYLCAPAPASALVRVTNKITTGLNVIPSSEATDDALERLQSSLAAATRGNKAGPEGGQSGGIGLISIHEDPELAKKKAEVAEKEKLRAQRRREAQEQRERDRTNRVLGRSGLRTGGGLTAAGLEDDELGMGLGRPRAPRGPKRRRARRDEYSEDEEEGYGRRGRTREDEYDEEDDFVARSDEDDEVAAEDDDEDIDEGIDLGRRGPKRAREGGGVGGGTEGTKDEGAADAGGEEDAEGEVIDEEEVVVSRAKRRRVVEEDEDE